MRDKIQPLAEIRAATRKRAILPIICLGFLSLGALLEIMNLAANVRAAQARVALNIQQPGLARMRAEQALRLNPWHERAAFSRCMALRSLGQSRQVAEYAESLTCWHPQRPLLQLIAGEAWLGLDQPVRAATDLWAGLWSSPIPSNSPAVFWRETWLAASRSESPTSSRARAAQRMTEILLLNADAAQKLAVSSLR